MAFFKCKKCYEKIGGAKMGFSKMIELLQEKDKEKFNIGNEYKQSMYQMLRNIMCLNFF